MTATESRVMELEAQLAATKAEVARAIDEGQQIRETHLALVAERDAALRRAADAERELADAWIASDVATHGPVRLADVVKGLRGDKTFLLARLAESTARIAALEGALRAVIPYAESRVEDLTDVASAVKVMEAQVARDYALLVLEHARAALSGAPTGEVER